MGFRVRVTTRRPELEGEQRARGSTHRALPRGRQYLTGATYWQCAGLQLRFQAPAFSLCSVLPLKQTPELNCAKENQGKRLSFVSEDSRLREKRAQGPQVCHRVAGRGGAFSLELPDSFQGLPVPPNYLLTQECLRTAPLGPVCHLLLAWPTARGDRKPPPQSWLP